MSAHSKQEIQNFKIGNCNFQFRDLCIHSVPMIIQNVSFRRNSVLFVFATAFILSVGAFSSPNANAQTPQARHQYIISAIDSGNIQSAINELHTLRSSEPKTFELNNYDYLLARLSERAGDTTNSLANYESVVARKSLLTSYALWHLAQMARRSGDLVLERERLRQFLVSTPASPLREAVMLRLGESSFESREYDAAVAALRSLTASSKVSLAREALTITAQALLRSGKQDQARDIFSRLLMQMPDASRPDDFALESVKALDALNSDPTQLTEADHLLRASVYHFNRDFNGARVHYQAVVDLNAQSLAVPNALYQIGRSYFQQGQYDEALKYLQRVTNEFPNSSSNRDATTLIAGAYNRLKRTDDALAAYRSFIARFPDDQNLERTYLNIIDALHEARRYKEALDWVRQTRARFPNQLASTLALFAQTRIHLAQSSWSDVVSDVDELKKVSDLGGARFPGGTTPAEVTFLQAFALERMGKTTEAIERYLSIPDGRNEYYGQLATARLQSFNSSANNGLIRSREQALRQTAQAQVEQGQFAGALASAHSGLRLSTDQTRGEWLKLVREIYSKVPAYQMPMPQLISLGRNDVIATPPDLTTSKYTAASELFFLGLYDEAVPAYSAETASNNAAANSSPTKAATAAVSNTDYTLAVLAVRGGQASAAVRFAERLWKPIPADFVIEVAPPQLVELLYPVSFTDSLLNHTSTRGIDPRLVLSIARQESRFQTDAKSVAAARGMMQFIPETANEVAKQVGKTDFQQEQLYNPDTAVLFGSEYLASLFKKFSSEEAVAAAYNGGSDNVSRWIDRSRSTEPARYVPEIGFAQTKDYVFRVMTNLHAYRQLYNSKLQRQ
jgi:soluble lytic murein transglycosylase